MLQLILLIVIAYLIGSIPTSILLVRAVKQVDIRNYGSGNAGGTNVSRMLGWRWGVFVILADALKGFLAAAVLPLLLPGAAITWDSGLIGIIGGVVAMLGHVFPIFAGFRGGKGVATAAGVAIGVAQPLWAVLGALLVFALLLAVTRYMFMASIMGGIIFALVILVYAPAGAISLRVFAVICALLLIILHHANIGRFWRGKEGRLGEKTSTNRNRAIDNGSNS